MAYTQIMYHLVFRTKYSRKVLNLENSEHLYRYIWGVINNKNCHLYQINGMEDHIHILTSLHQSIALADFIKDVKISSSKWMKTTDLFPEFTNWSVKYAALTYSYKEKNILINYIKRQREHHKAVTFKNEVTKLFEENGIIDDGWFWEET